MSKDTTPPANIITIEDFFTRSKANEGIKTPILFPDGTPSGKHLIIRGVDSDFFHKAVAEKQRKQARQLAGIEAKINALPEKDKEAFREKLMADEYESDEESEIDQLAALVAGWDLDQEFTPDNLKQLLRQAPQIRTLVDMTAVRRSSFFKRH